jgi:RNA polymerase sigma factor (sigma-70 family)
MGGTLARCKLYQDDDQGDTMTRRTARPDSMSAPRLPARWQTAAAAARTARRSPAFRAWMGEIAAVSPPGGLTDEEEEVVGREILRGSAAAVTFMVEANLPLALAVAAIYEGQGVEYEDLVSVANEALWRAARTFDYHIGRFVTHGTWACWRACRAALLSGGRTIRIPAYILEVAAKLQRARQRAAARGLEVSLEEWAADNGIPLAHALAATDAPESIPLSTIRVSAGHGTTGGEPVEEWLTEEGLLPADNYAVSGPERAGEASALTAQLQAALPRASLGETEVLILRHTYGLERADVLGKSEIARRLGVSRQTVVLAHALALNKLRLAMGEPAQPIRKRKRRPKKTAGPPAPQPAKSA